MRPEESGISLSAEWLRRREAGWSAHGIHQAPVKTHRLTVDLLGSPDLHNDLRAPEYSTNRSSVHGIQYVYRDFGNLPYQPAFNVQSKNFKRKTYIAPDLYMICLDSTLPLLALQGLPFVPGLLAATSPIHAGIAPAPHASDEHLRRMVTLSLSFNNYNKTIRRYSMIYHNDMIYIYK